MGTKGIALFVAMTTLFSAFTIVSPASAEELVPEPGSTSVPSIAPTEIPLETTSEEIVSSTTPTPAVSELPAVDTEEVETEAPLVETLPSPQEVAAQSGLFDGEVSVSGATVMWSTEIFFPSGCSRFTFYYFNYTGIRLLSLEMNITDSTGNLIAWESEIGINDGVSGTWSTQICGHQLDAGPEFYNVELIIEDYRSNTLSDADYLWFVGVPGTLDNFVMNLFYDFIGRPATYDEISDWSTNLRYGIWSRSSVTNVMSTSDSYIRSMIYNFYIDTLGREPDQAGYQYWINTAKNGRPIADIGSFFYGSDEYFQGYGQGNNADWIRDLYLKLMLRPADDGGLNYWVGKLASGQMNRTQVAMWFYQSPEKRGLRVDALYQNLLGRASDPGGRAYWANRLTAEGDIALSNSLASSPEYFSKQFRLF
jgi:hypothetical protein